MLLFPCSKADALKLVKLETSSSNSDDASPKTFQPKKLIKRLTHRYRQK